MFNFPCILIGRLIAGGTNGVLLTLMGKIINDSIPNEVMQSYSLVTNCGIGFGIFYSGVVSAIVLPLKEEGR